MASSLEELRNRLLRREDDAPETTGVSPLATEKTLSPLDEIRMARERAASKEFTDSEKSSRDLWEDTPLHEEIQNVRDRGDEIAVGAQLKEGTKDMARQVGTFATAAGELVALRNMSDEFLAQEREKPFSTFGPGVQVRDEFLRTLPKDPAKKKAILEDPEKFAQARVDYVVKNNTQYAAQAKKARAYVQAQLKADPNYLQTTGFVEDFIRMGPQIGGQILAGVATGGAGSAALMFAQIAGGTIEQQLAEGVELDRAMQSGMMNAAVQAPMEAFALGKLTGVFKLKGQVLGKLKATGDAIGTEWITEFMQSYPDAASGIWAQNPDQKVLEQWDTFLDEVLTLEHTAGAAKEATIASMWGGIASAPTVLTSSEGKKDNTRDPKVAGSELSRSTGGKTRTAAEGVHIIENIDEMAEDIDEFEASQKVEDYAPSDGQPTVRNLLGIETETSLNADNEAVIPDEVNDGVVVGSSLTVTPTQSKKQLKTNDAVNSILEDMSISKGLERRRENILNNQATLDSLDNQFTEALVMEDHKTALQYADNYQKVAAATTDNVEKFLLNRQQKLSKDDATVDPDEIKELGRYTGEINERAAEMVTSQQKAVAAEEAMVNLESEKIKTEDPKALKQALVTAEENTKGQNDQAAKMYRDIHDMQEMKDHVKTEYFMEKTLKTEKLIKMKGDLQRKIKAEASDRNVDADTKSTDAAALSWVDEQITEKSEYDADQDLANANEEQRKLLNEKAKRLTQSDPAVQAERAQVRGEVVKTTAEKAKKATTATATETTAKKATLTEQRIQAVQKQQTKTRKAPATPVTESRKDEIAAARTRATAKKKQAAEVAKIDSKPSGLPKKAKIKDLQDKKSEYVIITPDNPQSAKDYPKALNRQARIKLGKELRARGIEYETVDSFFEGSKEKAFIIKGMSQKEGKELSDRLNQSSYIHAKGENIALIEGDTANIVKKKDAKVRPDSEVYSIIEGKRWHIPFYSDKSSEIGDLRSHGTGGRSILKTESFELAGDEVSVARKAFKSAAIKIDGKVYEGTSHIGIIMDNNLEDVLISDPKVADGFVTHNNKFVSREEATELVGKKDGESLYSEDFIRQGAAQIKGERLQKATGMEVDNLESMTLKDQMGTLEMVDELKGMMDSGKYSWLFDKTKDLGVETHFITAKGQYKSIDAVKRAYPDMKSLEGAVDRFEGSLKLDPATGWMIPRGGVKGVYLKMKPLQGNLAGKAIINMPIVGDKTKTLDQALETVVHEHIHGLVDHGLKKLSPKESAAFKTELETIWGGIPKEFIKETRDDKNTHRRIRAGINQITNDGVGELITYSMAHPEFANWLNTIPASPRFKAKSSKIKTMWDALVDLVVNKVMKVPTKLTEVQDALNQYLSFADSDARFSKEARFDFGANVSTQNVKNWSKELDDNAENAIPTQVVENKQEAEALLGFEIDDNVASVWMPARTITDKIFTGKKTPTVRKTDLPAQVVIIASNIESQDHLTSKWMHEQVGHQGLHNLFSNNVLFNRFLDQINSLVDPDMMAEIIELYDIGKVKGGKRTLTKSEKRFAVEETLARRFEKMKPYRKKGILAKFKTFLNKWLSKVFVDVQKKRGSAITDAQLNTIMEAAKETVITGDTSYGDYMNKKLADRAPKRTFTGWKTLPKFMFDNKTYKKWMLEVENKSPDIRKWYQQHSDTLKESFGKDTDMINILLSVTSPQADVNANVTYAVQTYAYMMGLTNKPNAMFVNKLKKRIDENWTSPKNMLADLESRLFKVTEFNRALNGDVDATVGDMWMYRAFFGDNAVYNSEKESFSIPQVVGMRQKIHDLAAEMTQETGNVWTPREVQAAIWVYVNAKQTGKGFDEIASFQSGFNKPSNVLGGKTPLEWLKNLVPNLSDGPLSDHIGLEGGIPMAPISPLAKQRLTQIRQEMKARGKKINKFKVDDQGEITTSFNSIDEGTLNMIDAIAAGGRRILVPETAADWYRETFGFEVVNEEGTDVDMVLSDEALAAFTNDKGKVTAPQVRDNLGGYSGTYTQVARFSREARINLDHIKVMSQNDINDRDADLIKTGNDGQSVLGKVHEWRDQSARNIDRLADSLEQEFLEKFGGRTARIGSKLGSGRLLHTAETELLNKAMNLHLDSGKGKNTQKVDAYVRKMKAKGTKNLTLRERDHLSIIDKMQNMTQEQIAWAESNIATQYQGFFDFAQENKIIDSHVDNYVKRQWNMPKEYEDAAIVWNGTGTSGFKLVTSSGKKRSFDSIIDGWNEGMDLRGEGAIQNMQEYATEIGYVFANRRFTEYMRGLISFTSGGLMHEVNTKTDPDFKAPAGMTQVRDQGFVKPFHKLYARTDIATALNKMGRRPSSQLWDVPVLKQIRKINAMLKSTILSVSLFHHFAGLRSYLFGVSGKKWGQWNPIKAYKRGLDKLESRTGLTDPRYKHLGPIADMLVREGLTVGRVQDWDQAAIQDSFIENILLSKGKGDVAGAALKTWQEARRLKRSLTSGLFGRLFAGLKVEAGAIELVHKMEMAEKKKGRALSPAEIKTIAGDVASLINADFGGLHTQRMGRNPDLQRAAQLTLLAPDWTESNWRTVTGLVPGLNNWVGKKLGDNPETKGMSSMYRKFWGGIAYRSALSVIAFQALMLAGADDEEREEYVDFMVSNLTDRKKFAKGRWIGLDTTPLENTIRKQLGFNKSEKRRVVSVLGHFKDILKVTDPRNLVKHKVSPVASTFESLWSGTDWKGSRFTTVKEFIETGKFSADNKYAEEIAGFDTWSTLPSILGYRLRQSFPIFLAQGAEAVQGESSYISAALRAAGLDVRDVSHQPAGKRLYEEKRGEINKLERDLDTAKQSKDRTLIREAQADIKAYPKFNTTKNRINYARTQLSVVNKSIKGLELKRDEGKKFTKFDERRLEVLKQRKQKIYDNFNKVINR